MNVSASTSFDVLIPVLIMFLVGIVIFGLTQFLSRVVAPRGKKQGGYNTPYECGEEPTGEAWSLFNVRFYVVGLVFIIFDVEAVLMFPVASVFKDLTELGYGTYILVEFLLFITILTAGLAYCWRKGDLDWVKSFRSENKGAKR